MYGCKYQISQLCHGSHHSEDRHARRDPGPSHPPGPGQPAGTRTLTVGQPNRRCLLSVKPRPLLRAGPRQRSGEHHVLLSLVSLASFGGSQPCIDLEPSCYKGNRQKASPNTDQRPDPGCAEGHRAAAGRRGSVLPRGALLCARGPGKGAPGQVGVCTSGRLAATRRWLSTA